MDILLERECMHNMYHIYQLHTPIQLHTQTRIVFSFDANLYVMGYDSNSCQNITVPVLLPVSVCCVLYLECVCVICYVYVRDKPCDRSLIVVHGSVLHASGIFTCEDPTVI